MNGSAGRHRAVTAALAATVLVALAGLVLTGLEWGSVVTSDQASMVSAEAGGIAYAALGTLIVHRAGNLVGWFMLAEGAANAVMTTGSAYAIFGAKAHPGTLPAATGIGTLAEAVFVLVSVGLAAIFLVFPTGRLPSPRWRPAVLTGVVLTGVSLASFVVSTRTVALPAPGGISLVYPNPLAVRALQPVTWLGTLDGLAVLLLLLLGSAVVSLALRYRRGSQRLRQQMKWLGLAFAGVLACQAVGGLSIAAGQENKPLQQVPYAITPFLVFLGIPVAMAIAILRRRLFDIDVIISRALLVTLLSAGITAVYAVIVLGFGALAGSGSDPLLTVAAAVVIALVFQPLRQRASRLANRLVYGERATPYQVLSDFAADMAGQLDLGGALDRMVSLLAGAAGASRVEAWIRVGAELRPSAVPYQVLSDFAADMAAQLDLGDALDRMVSLLAGASGASRVEAWIRVGGELRPSAVWPPGSAPSAVRELEAGELPPFGDAGPGTRAVAVRHGEELLGAISLAKPPNEPLTSAEDSLLQHVASQAALVMRNARLTAELRATIDELRASRRRLVEAQDAERRKIERNLHDGAQQQLIALAIQLGLLAELADDPDLVRQAIPSLKAQLSTALDDLRALARGIYPPLLAEQGLVMALRAQAARSPVPVTLEADQVGRYPQDAESTVYFCTLEAQAARAALDDLRNLARGIYPPLLAEQGLVAALQAQVGKAPLPVRIEADGIGRYPPDTESTVYFCTLEALQNVAKHAQASRAAVRLSGSDGALEVSVSDDGAGFPAGTSHGSGLQGMSDRVAAHGGTLTVGSRPGQGTPSPPCTSARWRRCRTWPSTRRRRGPRSACPARTAPWRSRSATTGRASPPGPATAPACRACRTGWPRTAAP